MEIGAFVKARRESLGMTQEQLAEKIGVRAATVSRYESGDIDVLGLSGSRLQQLCDILRVQPNVFLNIYNNVSEGTMDDFDYMDVCRMYKEASRDTQMIIKGMLMQEANQRNKPKKGIV